MRRNSWFSRWSQRWGQALKHSQQSLRSQRRAARKCDAGRFIEPMESRILLSAPTLATIGNVEVGYTAPVIVGLDGADAESDALSYSVNITKLNGTAVSNPHLTTEIISGVNGTSTNKSMVINVSYYVDGVLTTGTMVFELFDNLVPEITSQFEALVTSGHYNGLTFDRLEKDFALQTGSYKYSNGAYVYQSSTHATFEDQFNVDLLHTSAGLLSSAKTSADDTNSTNFFVTDYAGDGTISEYILRNLDFNHSVFGKIVEGMDVFDAITNVATYPSGNINRPSTPITITSATIEEKPENATLLLKVTSGYTPNEKLLVTVTATDGDNETVVRSFEVTLTNDRYEDDELGRELSYIIAPTTPVGSAAVPNYINIYNSNPFLNDISEVYIPGGSSNYTLTVTSTDIDGFKQYYFEEYINGTLVASYAYENATLSILNQDTLGADGQPLNTTYGSANYWGNYLDLTTYTPDDIDTTGLTYTIGEATTSGNQQSINVNFTGITSDTVGVYHLLLARYNTVTSTKTGNSYDSTAYDTQVITLTVRPDTPTLTINSGSGGLTNDSTPSIIVAGLTVGATLKILDEEDHVVATTTVTNATTQLSVTTLADGVHTLRAVQVVNDAESEEGTATVTIDTVAPQAFIDVALAAAQVNNTTTTDVYTYQIGHPEANEGTVTFSLEANHAGDVIPGDIGINIDDTTGLLTWTNPTDTYFPSVSFDIVAEDAAGNRTVEHVTLQVNSYVDISGVVYLDANDNGTADDGEEQSGVRVYADLNGNNIADENELESYSAITASNGGYELHNVPAGSVVLHQELADGYQQLSPTDTQLTLVQVIKQGDVATINDTATTVDGLTWAGALTMSPDGKYVYASSGSGGTTGLASSNSNDAIAVFERNADDGSLTYIQLIKNNVDGITGLDDPNNLVVTPDGRHVYVTCNNATTDTVVIFERDAGSGKLTQVGLLTDGGSYALNGASNVIVSEDNEFVYISAASSKAINVFSRNRFSGQLTLVQSIVNETRLAGVSQMTISPTISNYDSFLYAGSNEGMVVYKRDVVTGMLMAKQNVDGANLSGMRQIAITPDGLHLYAASYGDNALNIFQRDLSTGFLMWQDVILGQNANGATSVKINPEGTKLYFSDLYADALYVYDIASDGALSPDPLVPQTLTRNGTDPLGQTITDLDGDVAILLSPDGNDVYVASRSSNTIGVYSNRTRSWSGAALIVDATPTNDNTGQNFLNDYNAITVDSVDFNLEQFNSDRPTGKSVNAPINWTTQRSSIRDITLTFSAQLNEADTANILLQRVFDVDGNAVTDTITLSASDVTIVGNQLIISNLNLEDGVYQLTVYQTFDAALDGLYSTVFHQLLGDFNGDKAVNPADLTALLYWQQLAAGSTSYGDVPAYLDVRNASDQPIADGRVDSHDFDVITSKFGKFIPKSAIPQDPIPQIVFPSTAPGHASDTLAMAFYTSQPVSLQLIASDDEQTTTGLLDQLDNPNLILEILESQ